LVKTSFLTFPNGTTMNQIPKFYRNLWGDLQGGLDATKWTSVTEAWNQHRHQDSFYFLLDYINTTLRQKHGNAAQTEFNVPHGSVVVNIAIKDQLLEINCGLVDIVAATRIPLLRKVTELNFYPLSLAQMRLTGNQLNFHYKGTLDTCEPYKIYYVLKEICQTADRYDDEFKEKFKAKGLVEPRVKYFTTAQNEMAWNQTSEIISETLAYTNYFDQQRWFGCTLDFLVLALKRIDLCTQLQGFLKTELELTIGTLNNGNVNMTDRIQTGKKFLAQIQQMGKDNFVKNLYEIETFVPHKARTNAAQVRTNIQGALTNAQKYHNEKSYINSVIEAHYSMYDLFYQNNMDHAVNAILMDALARASEKTWMEASGILVQGLQTINTQFAS
jgi:hypothetical protein